MQVPRDASWLALPAGVLAAGAVLAFAPLAPPAARMLAITLFCIALWIGNPISPALTGLVGLFLIGATFSPDLAFTGFQSPAVWLIVFGLLMGEAARRSGLAEWGSRQVLDRAWPDAGGAALAYRRLLLAGAVGAVALAFLIPSTLVRILTMAPVLRELGEPFESRQARIGLFLGPILATFYAGPGIFTAGLPNVIATGIAESLGASGISWTAWTAQMFPVMGLGRALLVTGIVYALFRPDPGTAVSSPAAPAGTTGDERRMLVFLLVGVLLWVTDFAHGLHPVFGALLVVALSLAPRIGVVTFEDLADVDLSIVFFLGAVFAIGRGLTETGFTETAAAALFAYAPQDAGLPLVLATVLLVTVALTFLIEGLAVASVLTPLLVSYARGGNVPLDPVLMTESIALHTYVFPYQSAPLVALLGMDVVDAGTLVRTLAWCSVLTTVVLFPLQVGVFVLLY